MKYQKDIESHWTKISMQIDLDHLLLSPIKGAKATPFKTLFKELMSLPFPIID